MNIYLIAAESYHLIDREIQKIVKNRPFLLLNLNMTTIADVIKEASYYSLDNQDKIIVASNANFFGSGKSNEEEVDLLSKYLANPSPQTTIIFTTQNGIDLRRKITKTIKDKYHLINLPKLNYQETQAEIMRVVKDNDYRITMDSVSYIQNNTMSLDNIYEELKKIFLYYGDEKDIKYQDVTRIVGSLVDNNNFHFVAAVIAKNLQTSLKILANLKVYKVEPLALIILLAREYRQMYYLKRYQANHRPLNEICKAMNLQDWQVNKLYNNSLNYQESELLANIRALADLDIGIKTGKYDKDVALMSFLITVCN